MYKLIQGLNEIYMKMQKNKKKKKISKKNFWEKKFNSEKKKQKIKKLRYGLLGMTLVIFIASTL